MTEEETDQKIRDKFASLDMLTRKRAFQYLKAGGWLKSTVMRMAMDQEGGPLPWYTYSAIYLLERRMRPDLEVFEFGSGQSTLWWASRVKQVTSVEHHHEWHAKMKPLLPANVTYSHVPLSLDGPYCRAAEESGGKYDVIVVDGRDRVNCSKHTVPSLTDRGVIVWDNSEREMYKEAQAELIAAGFKRVDFIGAGPINTVRWETAIFYRDGNWLGL